MTNFVYFDPVTLQIKWQSDRNDVMDFPSVESKDLIYTPNFIIEEVKWKYTLKALKNQYTDEEWQQITNPT